MFITFFTKPRFLYLTILSLCLSCASQAGSTSREQATADVKPTALIDPTQPPAAIRLQVEKDGEARTIFLMKYSRRIPNYTPKQVAADGTITELNPGPVRTYIGWCEEEPDSMAVGTVCEDGAVTYHVFRAPSEEGKYVNADWGNDRARRDPIPVSEYKLIGGKPNFTRAKPLKGATFVDSHRLDSGEAYQLDHGFDVSQAYMQKFKVTTDAQKRNVIRLMEDALNKFAVIQYRDTLCDWRMDNVLLHFDDYKGSRGRREFWKKTAYPDTTADLVAHIKAGGGGGSAGGLGDAHFNSNGASKNGSPFVVFRHEAGHNLGAGDHAGAAMDGRTILNGNSVSRFSAVEISRFLAKRKELIERYASDASKGFTPIKRLTLACPPCPTTDVLTTPINTGTTFSPLVNDYDANGDRIALAGYRAKSNHGGTVEFISSNGVNQLKYTPATDFYGMDRFSYTIVDSNGQSADANVIVYVQAPRQLVSYWNFDETGPKATIWTNLVNPEKNAKLYNRKKYRTDVPYSSGVAGRFGKSLQVKYHEDENILPQICSPSVAIDSDELTIAAWVNADNWLGKDKKSWGPRIMQIAGRGQCYRLNVEHDQLAFWITTHDDKYKGVWNKHPAYSPLPETGEWVHLAAVYRDGCQHLYVNGKEQGKRLKTGNVIEFVGEKNNKIGLYLNGKIDDLRIYAKGLSQSEIHNLMKGGVAEIQSPFDGMTAFAGKTLRWVPGADMQTQHIYFGTSKDAVSMAGPDSKEFRGKSNNGYHSPTDLIPEIAYFWRVDTITKAGETLKGATWSFTEAK